MSNKLKLLAFSALLFLQGCSFEPGNDDVYNLVTAQITHDIKAVGNKELFGHKVDLILGTGQLKFNELKIIKCFKQINEIYKCDIFVDYTLVPQSGLAYDLLGFGGDEKKIFTFTFVRVDSIWVLTK